MYSNVITNYAAARQSAWLNVIAKHEVLWQSLYALPEDNILGKATGDLSPFNNYFLLNINFSP